MIKYSDLEIGYMFVNTDPMFEARAVINKETGEIFQLSPWADDDELPDDIEDKIESDAYISIPDKHDLDLGSNLVFEFVSEHLEQEYANVQNMFRSKGAYGRFKALLQSKGLEDKWFKFKEKRTKQALLEWAREVGLKVDENK